MMFGRANGADRRGRCHLRIAVLERLMDPDPAEPWCGHARSAGWPANCQDEAAENGDPCLTIDASVFVAGRRSFGSREWPVCRELAALGAQSERLPPHPKRCAIPSPGRDGSGAGPGRGSTRVGDWLC